MTDGSHCTLSFYIATLVWAESLATTSARAVDARAFRTFPIIDSVETGTA